MSLSNALEASILDHLFGLATWTAPANLYVGLSTADPLDDGSGLAEPTDNNYARVQCDPGSDRWARSGNTVDNVSAIIFNTSSGAWGTISHVCFFLASTGGIPLWSFALSEATVVGSGVAPRYAAGTLDTNLD